MRKHTRSYPFVPPRGACRIRKGFLWRPKTAHVTDPISGEWRYEGENQERHRERATWIEFFTGYDGYPGLDQKWLAWRWIDNEQQMQLVTEAFAQDLLAYHNWVNEIPAKKADNPLAASFAALVSMRGPGLSDKTHCFYCGARIQGGQCPGCESKSWDRIAAEEKDTQ
ncbi:unnamed protein product [marine sediment metagenome]|uniref:Uncharacterized protein n=1 Tax=marine sediment metagenome TaxID=412755 RepID=X1G3F8_9ZZZZ